MKGFKKLATITMATLVAITLLLPSYSTVANAATKTVRDVRGNYVSIDTDNLAYAEEDDAEEISYGSLIKRNRSNSKPWVKNDKRYLPFTDSYLSSKKYEAFLKKVSTQKTIKTKKAGKLSTKKLQLAASTNNGKISIKLSNSGKTKLTDVRLYCFQDNGIMRIFADSAENQIAYTKIRTADCVTVKAAEMETEKIGLEDISAKLLTSTDGTYIGADSNGKIAAGETISLTMKVNLATSLPIPAPKK